ncbi:MAG TPA: hypothetical protein VH599_13780 [Ktedonobacterales bacterium]|jgi:hypothetical protein
MKVDTFDRSDGMDASRRSIGGAAAQRPPLTERKPTAEDFYYTGPRRPVSRRQALALLTLGTLLALATLYHYLIYLPQPDKPHALTLLDDVFALGVVGLVALAGLAVGMRLLRPFNLADFSRLERGALALGLGWGIFSLGVLALGLAHLLYPWALLAALGLALALCWREAQHLLALCAQPGLVLRARRLLPRSILTRILGVIVLIQLALLLLHTLAPPYLPYGYDLYLYHWAAPRLYLLHHAVLVWPGWAAADLPFNSELLATLALAFGSEVAATWMQSVFGVLIVILLIAPLYRRVGSAAAWIGLALCFASPLFTTLLISGYNELAMAYYGLAAVAVTFVWLKQSRQPEASGQAHLILLAGLYSGFGLGTKYTAGQIVVGILVLLIGVGIARLLNVRRQRIPVWPLLRQHTNALLLYGGACLLPLLPWLVRDWALLGNPIYPFLWGGPAWNEARTITWDLTMAHTGPQEPFWQRLPESFFGLFFDLNRLGEPFYTPANFLLVAALLVPIILVVGWSRFGPKRLALAQSQTYATAREQALWLAVAAGAYIAWLLSGAQLERYAVAWLLLLIGPAAFALDRLCRIRWQWPFGRVIAQLLRSTVPTAILLLVIYLIPLSSLIWLPYHNPLPLVSGQVSLQRWERTSLMSPGYWAMVDYVNANIPRSAKLLVIGPGYYLEGRDYVDDASQDWVPYLETAGQTPAGMLTLLRQNGFAYLLYNDTLLTYIVRSHDNTYLDSFLPAFRQFLAGSLTLVQSFRDFQLYQIPSG